MNLRIENMVPGDWEQVSEIYRQGIESGIATFETQVPSWEVWNAKHHSDVRPVIHDGSEIQGWAAINPVSHRDVYRGVAEVSLYMAREHHGKGFGWILLDALIKESEAHGFWTLEAVILPENKASIALFKKCGFRKVGIRKRIGKHQGIWHDTVLLERRSKIAGND